VAADDRTRLSRQLTRHLPAWTLGWNLPAEIGMLYTSLDQCLCVELGQVRSADVELLTQRRFDQAPVVTRYDADDRAGFPEGLVTTEHLKSLLESGAPLQQDDPAIAAPTLPLEPTLGVLLDTLADSRAALVVEDEHQGTAMFRLFRGLITISDLNRQSFRGLLYTLLADLEAGLARFLEVCCPEPWDWLSKVSEDHQVRILGSWELSKRNGVDVSPVTAATLALLLTAVGKIESLRSKLDYPSRSKFEEATGRIAKLRNAIMHPVRPLVLTCDDVAAIRTTLEAVFSLCHALAKLGFMERPRTPDGQMAVTLATFLAARPPDSTTS
jgi:hypothetical protein